MFANPATMTFGNFSIARRMAEIGQMSMGPAFELAFFATQNAILDKLDAEVSALLEGTDETTGRTAHLRIKVKHFELELDRVHDYSTRVTSNRVNITTVQAQLTELRDLASSGTVAEFDTKKADILETVDKLRVAGFSFIGAPDRLRATKASAIAAMDGIVHNNFATQGDIDTAQAAIDAVIADFTTSAELVEINYDLARKYDKALDIRRAETKLKIDNIAGEDRSARLDKVKERQQYYANVLSIISLAFEAALTVTKFVSDNANFQQKRPEPGSVLNLFL